MPKESQRQKRRSVVVRTFNPYFHHVPLTEGEDRVLQLLHTMTLEQFEREVRHNPIAGMAALKVYLPWGSA